MTGVSHAITGATIAAIVQEPLLALPAAFVSHFVCDMIPHVGIRDISERRSRQATAHRIYMIDLALILVFFGVLILVGAPWVVLAGAFVAGSPDFVWFYRYIIKEQLGGVKPGSMNIFNRFHSRIQWSETLRYGVVVELVFSGFLLLVLQRNL